MDNPVIEIVSLHNPDHCEALVNLLNEYMKDDMGLGKPMPSDMASRIVNGLKEHKGYLGFLVKVNTTYVGLANCNLNFSTWNAKPIINIHDFIVHPVWREKGIGSFLLQKINDYAVDNDFCKINLEVREDNIKAQMLYEKEGFKAGIPQMLFWEKYI